MHRLPTTVAGRGAARARAGGALALALIALMTVAVLGMSYLALSGATAREEAGALDKKLAFYVAEAGLAEAWAGLVVGRSGDVGTPAVPAVFGDGLFWVEATELGDGLVRLESTGLVGRGRARLAIVVQRGETSVVSLGMFSGEPLAVPAGSRIDGWDSSAGPYPEDPEADPAATGGARLGSNAEVVLDGTERAPTVIEGDVTAGPQRSVQLTPWVQVEGEVTSAHAAHELPAVELPARTMERGLIAGPAAPVVVVPGERGLQSVHVQGGGRLLLQGPAAHVIGNLQVDSGGELAFDTSAGRVDLWIERRLDLAEGASVSTSSTDPSQVLVQVGGVPSEPIVLAARSAFHGIVYAPEAEVSVGPAFEVFGGVSARQLTLGGPVRMHFDQNLLAVAARLALPTMVSWRLIDVSTEATGGLDADPFHRLGLDRASLPSPFEAHPDQRLEIVYLDGSSSLRTYEGPESGFDWTDVSEVLEGTRDGVTLRVPGKDALGGIAGGTDPASTPTEDPLLTALKDPAKTSAELRDELLAAAPVRPAILATAVMRTPHLDSADMETVLLAHLPLDEQVGVITVGTPGALTDADLEATLIAASPLPRAVVDALLARDPPLDPTALGNVLAAQ
jgi:hypothetical protein